RERRKEKRGRERREGGRNEEGRKEERGREGEKEERKRGREGGKEGRRERGKEEGKRREAGKWGRQAGGMEEERKEGLRKRKRFAGEEMGREKKISNTEDKFLQKQHLEFTSLPFSLRGHEFESRRMTLGQSVSCNPRKEAMASRFLIKILAKKTAGSCPASHWEERERDTPPNQHLSHPPQMLQRK
ncbi:Octapeptide-repeat protein T2, partial [Ophiophagus hannah]